MASNHMNPNVSLPATPQPKRSERKRILSDKAQAAKIDGQNIPGLRQTSSGVASATPTPHSHQLMPARGVSLTERTMPQASRKKAPKSKGAPSPPPVHYTHGDHQLPDFSHESFLIYLWPRPAPIDFSSVTKAQREWKAEVDEDEEATDCDDGSDDWDEFAGNPDYYPDPSGFYSAIARVFVNRAKRAYRAGISWTNFERDELSINPRAVAEAEPDQRKRFMLLDEALDPRTRMDVFDALKERLCNEIWLEAYTPLHDRAVARDSVVSEQNDMGAGQAKNDPEQTVEGWEAEDKVVLDSFRTRRRIPVRFEGGWVPKFKDAED